MRYLLGGRHDRATACGAEGNESLPLAPYDAPSHSTDDAP